MSESCEQRVAMVCINLRTGLLVVLAFFFPAGIGRLLKGCCNCFKLISAGPLRKLIRLHFLVRYLASQQTYSPWRCHDLLTLRHAILN